MLFKIDAAFSNQSGMQNSSKLQ